jgi:hypothetical protein
MELVDYQMIIWNITDSQGIAFSIPVQSFVSQIALAAMKFQSFKYLILMITHYFQKRG